MGLVLLLVINIICIFICYFVAKWRGANVIYWAMLGALLGPLSLPFLLFMRSNKNVEKNKLDKNL